MEQGTGRRRRRMHSAEFKAEAVAACRRPDASIAACAMERSINANLLRRWVVEAERSEPAVVLAAASPTSTARERFISLPIAAPAQSKSVDDAPVRIEIRRGTLTVNVQWPACAIQECAVWLREVLK